MFVVRLHLFKWTVPQPFAKAERPNYARVLDAVIAKKPCVIFSFFCHRKFFGLTGSTEPTRDCPMRNPLQDDWLNGTKQGDREILGAKLQQCRPDLKRRIEWELGRASVGGHISASDIVQDACERVLQKHDQFRGHIDGEWLMWVRMIATNFLLMELRKNRVGNQSLDDIMATGPESLIEQLINTSRSPSEKLRDKELVTLIRAAIQEMTPRDQTLVYYRCELGLKWDEVGAKLGCSSDAAWNRFNLSVLPELELRLEILHGIE